MKNQQHDFFEMVYKVVNLIPYGRVTSYGAIANYLGSRGSSRMVGWAMNHSHKLAMKIPAHRVVNRNGLLTGKMHFNNPLEMETLLKKEGAVIVDDQILNFKEIFWNPEKELTI